VAGALGRLDGLQPTRSDVTGHGTGLQCADRALETSQRPMAGTLQGPLTRAAGGVRNIGSEQHLPSAKKSGCSDAQGCPECGPPIVAP
jgi:hypothetical protein